MKLPPGHVPGMGVHKATAYGGFGQKMLEKMGWNKGQGLGKANHGMKEAIEVKKKEDTLGVGANTTGWKWDWKYWEDAYNTGMQSISKPDSKKKRRKKSNSTSSSSSESSSSSSSDSNADSDDDSSESDDEHNARLAEACGIVINRDGTTASATAAELKLAQQLAKDARGRAGRFGGREGKMARIRQQEAEQAAAMQAKLGIPQSASTGDLRGSSASEDTSADKKCKKRKQPATGEIRISSNEDASEATAAGCKKRSKKEKNSSQIDDSSVQGQQRQTPGDGDKAVTPGSSKSRVIVVVDVKGAGPNVEAFKAFKPTPSSGWWGAKMFMSAGLLEGLDKEQQQQRQRTTFDEDMQTAVYMAAHDAQRQGRRGLGKSTTLKIAGGTWQGKKVTFDQEVTAEQDTFTNNQPGGEQQQQQQQQAAVDGAVSSPSSNHVDTARAAGNSKGSSVPAKERKQPKRSKPRKVKWAKLAIQELQGTPGGVLKWSKLWRHLRQAAQQHQGAVGESCKEEAWKKLQGCSQLQVTGKLVSLAA